MSDQAAAAAAAAAAVADASAQLQRCGVGISDGENTQQLIKDAAQAFLAGNYTVALHTAKKAEEQSPKDPQVHRLLGGIYAKMRKNADAVKHYQRYLELDPNARDADKVREIINSP